MAALEFAINLSGNFAAALDHSGKALHENEKGAHEARKEFELFEAETGKLSGSIAGLGFNLQAIGKGGSLFTFDLAEGLHEVGELVERVVEGFIDLGKEMIKAAAGAEDLDLAIKLDVGDEAAEHVDKLAQSFKGTRFSPKAIKEALLPLLEESGTKDEDLWDDITTAATDVATRTNGRVGVAQAVEAMRSIELRPDRIGGALKELGIKSVDFYKSLGISAKEAAEQIKAGTLDSRKLLEAALNQIAAREGGHLGDATNKGSATLGATLEKLANLKDTIFERLAGSQGMKAVQGFLDSFIETLEGPIGTDLVKKIDGAFTTLFGDLSGPDGLAKMKEVIGELASRAEHLIDAFNGAWPQIKADFESILPIVEGIADAMGSIVHGVAELAKGGGLWGDAVAQSNIDAETGTVGRKELANGGHLTLDIKDRAGALDRAGKGGFFHRLFSSNDTLNSEAFNQLDDEKGAWEKVPQMADGGIVSRPTLALIGEAGPEAVVPLGRGGFGGGSITMGDFIFQLSPGTPQDQAAEAAQLFRAQVKSFIDEVTA